MKQLRLRRDDRCAGCGEPLSAGDLAHWDAVRRQVLCLTCVAAFEVPAGAPDVGKTEPQTGGPKATMADSSSVAPAGSEAGRSARAEYARRVVRAEAEHEAAVAKDEAWRETVVQQRPVIGRMARAMTPRPVAEPEKQSTTAWKVGAEGEERVAEVLRGVEGIEVLHDRRIPGSRANIDHLVVGPAGVFVVDAKKYKEGSAIEIREVGPLLRKQRRLYVGGRDRTKLVEGVQSQVAVVADALGADHASTPVSGVLCFVGADWGWRKKIKVVGGVTAVWPTGLGGVVGRTRFDSVEVAVIAERLRTALPPAAG